MTQSFTLDAETRNDKGKGASRRLRRLEQKVPAIIYGGSEEPTPISLEQRHLIKALENEAFYSQVLTLNVEGKPVKTVLKDLQRHPFKPTIVHADFQRIDESKALTLHVPLHFINEDSSVGVKKGAAISHSAIDVEISCLPKDLPEYIEVDMASADIGQIIHLSDIQLPEGVSIPSLALGSDHDLAIATVSKPKDTAEDEPAGE